ncbi:hypothetical protein [Chitinophaga sp. MM2321]|uniref:hypothetical protein n=1 Tax=Chitinophaga sp. MM2321 TaxID=3137178 RepID=UPI0032D5A88A
MKYQIIAALILLFAQNSGAQNNTFPTTGNVGIGTGVSVPQGKLQIATLATDSVSSIRIGTANDRGKIEVPVNGVCGGYNIDFHTWRDIDPNQIGARIRAERINTYYANNALIQGMDLVFSTSTGRSQDLLTEKMRILSNGNVGIGEVSPLAKLHVTAVQGSPFATFVQTNVAAADGSLSIINNTSAPGSFIPSLVGKSYAPGRPFGIYVTGIAEDIVPSTADASGAAVVLDGRTKTASKLLNNNVLAVSNYGESLMIVKADGNVGIGTTDTKGYKLAVNGSGIFTRLKVKSYGTWPDFVFDPGYQLHSLTDVEKYISLNKHLPGIPSAKEAEEEGIDLGDMNSKLLQKIEELTLYIIDMKKEALKQQSRVDDLERIIQQQ